MDSTNPGRELNPGYLFTYHTSKPPRSQRYCQWSLHEQISEYLYHMYENLLLRKIEHFF